MNQPALYLVGTPIGNLEDISPRVAKTLRQVDFIAAEDTRNTLKLLNHLQIKKPLISYFEHNKRQRGQEILEKIRAGQVGALVTDAGMPAISDPGEDLVALLYENGYTVTAVSGPCAMISGLVLSGLPTGRFCFEGFLSTVKKSRTERLEALRDETRTMIFYESPQKLCKTLADLQNVFGADRRITLTRELTKLHEQVLRGTIGQMVDYHAKTPPRGEYVLVVEGCSEPQGLPAFWQGWDIGHHIAHYIALDMPKMEAIKAVAKDRKLSKSEVYNAYEKEKSKASD